MNILNRLKRKATLFSLALLCTLGGALALHTATPTVETVIPAVAEETTESTPVETWVFSYTGEKRVEAKLYIDTENEGYYILFVGGTCTRVSSAPWYKNYKERIKTVIIEEGITYIEDNSFSEFNSLVEINIPSSITSIGGSAFSGCSSLASISIPESVTSIGSKAFNGCTNLKEVHITDIDAWMNIDVDVWSNPLYYAKNLYCNGELVKEVTIEDVCPDMALALCTSLEKVIIKEGVTSIGGSAFYNCSSLTSIDIPESVKSIANGAFFGCENLTDINIPEGVTSIGSSAFIGCSSLTRIEIPENVTNIGERAFAGSGLMNIKIPKGVLSIGSYAFSSCRSLINIELPEMITEIAEFTFNECSSLTEIYIPENVVNIKEKAFYECKNLAKVSVEKNIENMGEFSFYGCRNLKEIHVADISAWAKIIFERESNPLHYAKKLYSNGELVTEANIQGVESISTEAFYYCTSLEKVTIGEGVTSIGKSAFYDCSSLTSISIPESVTSIGGSAFNGCTNLKEVHITDINAWAKICFYNSATSNPLYYAKNLYCNGELVTEVNIQNMDYIDQQWAFYNCTSLEKVTVDENVILAGDFYGCTNLKEVHITDINAWAKIDFWGTNPLYYAKNLYCNGELVTEANIQGVDSIGTYAFYNCTSLEKVTIGEGVTSIGDQAFYLCEKLAKVTIDSAEVAEALTDKTACGYLVNYATEIAVRGDIETVGAYVAGFPYSTVLTYDGVEYVVYTQEKHAYTVKSAFLNLNDDINVVYRMSVPAGYEDAYAVFEFQGEAYDVKEYTVDSNGLLCFTFSKVMPQYMADNICVTLYAMQDGVEVGKTKATYSVKEYCEYMLSNTTDEKLIRLISDMLYYGEMTQNYRNYNEDAPITGGMDITPSEFVEMDESHNKLLLTGDKGAIDWKGAGLFLENDMTVRFKFVAESLTGLTVEVSVNGRTNVFTESDFVYENGAYYAYFKGVAAHEFDDAFTAIIKKDGAQVGRTLTYSVNSYIYDAQGKATGDLLALVKAIYNYGASALAYNQAN